MKNEKVTKNKEKRGERMTNEKGKMKNEKRSVRMRKIVLMMIIALALAFAACGYEEPGHKHSYTTVWKFDDTHHWHECAAADGAKTDIAEHNFDPLGHDCYDCGEHTHLYSDTWSYNATQHWHACINSKCVAQFLSIDIAGHEGNPCAVCGGWFWTAATDSAFGTTAIRAVAYGSDGNAVNKWVAVGYSGRIAYSADGENWTNITDNTIWQYTNSSGNPATAGIFAIAYGGNKWVAAGDNGKMAHSDDGENWTAVTDSAFGATNIRAIAYGGGKWVAAGDNGKIAHSDDGENWTAVTDSAFGTSAIRAIAYGDGRFVAAGDNGKMAYSADGANWTRVTDSTFQTTSADCIYAVAYGGGRFVAGGDNGRMAYSADGANWTKVTDSTFGTAPYDCIYAIVYGSNRFVAAGSTPNPINPNYSSVGKTANSADGATWTPMKEDYTFAADGRINAIAYGGGKFAAGGENGKIAYADWKGTN